MKNTCPEVTAGSNQPELLTGGGPWG